jgi:hypothetical protein
MYIFITIHTGGRRDRMVVCNKWHQNIIIKKCIHSAIKLRNDNICVVMKMYEIFIELTNMM